MVKWFVGAGFLFGLVGVLLVFSFSGPRVHAEGSQRFVLVEKQFFYSAVGDGQMYVVRDTVTDRCRAIYDRDGSTSWDVPCGPVITSKP